MCPKLHLHLCHFAPWQNQPKPSIITAQFSISSKEIPFLARWAAFLMSTLLMAHLPMVNQAEWTWWQQMLISSTPLVKSSIMQRWPRQAGTKHAAHTTTALLFHGFQETDTHVCAYIPSHQHLVHFTHLVWDYKSSNLCKLVFAFSSSNTISAQGYTTLSLQLWKWILTFNPLQSWKAHILPRKLKGIVAGPNGATLTFPIDDIAARDKVFITWFNTKQLVIIPVLICKTIKNHTMFAC